MTISTCQGPKIPVEALQMLRAAKLPAGSLLGIYRELLQNAPGEAAEATRYINDNPAKFNSKIRHLAGGQSSGRPTGTKNVVSSEQAMEMLQSAGPRPTVRIIFRKDRPERVTNITALSPKLIEFTEPYAVEKLVSCVRMSSEWQRIPRTYIITVKATSEGEFEQVATGFAAALESVELLHNLEDRTTVWTKGAIKSILSEHGGNIFYDESVFRATWAMMDRLTEADHYVTRIMNPNAPLVEILEMIPLMFRLHFLEIYIECFNGAMAAPA